MKRDISRDEAEKAIKTLLSYIGENPDREGLKGTPDRIIRMWDEIFRGYDKDKIPRITTFPNEEKETDIVFDSGDYYSMCEHHILHAALNGKALGFAIVMRGQHLCKSMRGVRNKGKMTVSHFTGVFKDDPDKRNEFYKLIDLQNE